MKKSTALRRLALSPAVSWCLLAALLVMLFIQAFHPWWRQHLEPDIGAFQSRANHFFSNGSWAGMDYNEYQPGALWFFAFLGFLTPSADNYEAFLTAAMLVNAALIAAHFAFFRAVGHRYAALFFLAVAAAMGPILLFRFELLVSLLTLVAWMLFQKDRHADAALLLGIATSIKLYPVVLMPVVLMPGFAARDWRGMLHTLLWFFIGLLGPVVLAIELGLSFDGMLQSLAIHQLKPVGLEGFWGNAITIVQYLAGIPLRITPNYGVHGLTTDLPLLSDPVLNNFWILPTGAAIIGIFRVGRRRGFTDPGYAFLLLFAFLFFSKVVNPQYLWWAVAFLPFIPLAWFKTSLRKFVILSVMAGLLMTQVIFPLNYTEYLDWFHGTVASPRLFVIMALRTLLLLVVLCVTAYRLTTLPDPEKR